MHGIQNGNQGTGHIMEINGWDTAQESRTGQIMKSREATQLKSSDGTQNGNQGMEWNTIGWHLQLDLGRDVTGLFFKKKNIFLAEGKTHRNSSSMQNIQALFMSTQLNRSLHELIKKRRCLIILEFETHKAKLLLFMYIHTYIHDDTKCRKLAGNSFFEIVFVIKILVRRLLKQLKLISPP